MMTRIIAVIMLIIGIVIIIKAIEIIRQASGTRDCGAIMLMIC